MGCELDSTRMTDRALEVADRVEAFVRNTIATYEKDERKTSHGRTDALADEMDAKAREAGVLTPHILKDGSVLTQLETAAVLTSSGLSPLGPVACNVFAPDEDNMYLLGKEASPELQERFLEPMIRGEMRSAFFMTEPAEEVHKWSLAKKIKRDWRKANEE